MSVSVGRQLLSTVSEFLSNRKQRVRLDGKVSASVDWVLGVLGSLLFILYISKLFHIVENHIVNYADASTIYAVIPGPLLHPQVMESLNQDLAAINYWC